ncbi:DUF4349 domain-containing protein [Bacillus sp. 31A1R]|uniref:DUF4349 domain-containing protein n=1 Tax=Robertmurraya mangrovi TaxID=3098077 RepID=A0ABU5ITX9_9BACI|nr:DUF4349 domain-containing protein [Bacillus sp. 31A1R]MDZ5470615.1 DUF4349 domain-containing protein [Bacillus sp. 31A1R]
MKVKTSVFISFLLACTLIFSGCSSDSKSSEYKEASKADMAEDRAVESENNSVSIAEGEKKEISAATSKANQTDSSRMVIYNAHLSILVKDFQKAVSNIEEKIKGYGGYVVDSNVYRDGETYLNGTITVRIPSENFQAFISDTEGIAVKVNERTITGQDVTEEYVDLESRLKSKRVVEERLLDFMSKAAKTEDLLRISSDLSAIQEEIEVILGRMKFLKNQTSFSTVTLNLNEDQVKVPAFNDEKLNTWEKTKKQFVSSANFIITMLSGLVIFIFGNVPILLFLGFIGAFIYIVIKRINKNRSQTPPGS